MFRKSEDKWIEIAFGEQKLPDGFSSKDADDIEVLKSYETLREDLQLLKDIPEMQFSNERLRDAILAAGPKASVEAPWVLRWGWAVAPIAAVLAVGVVFLKSNFPGPETNVVVAPAGLQASNAVTSGTALPLESTAVTKVPNVSNIGTSGGNRSTVVAVKSRTKASTRRKLGIRQSGVRLAMASNAVASKKTLVAEEATRKTTAVPFDANLAPGMSLTRDSGASAGASADEATLAPTKSETTGSVILIDSSSDSVTGLPNAIEVSKNSEKVSLGG